MTRYKILIEFTTPNNEDLNNMTLGEFMALLDENLTQINNLQIKKIKEKT